MKSNIYDDIYIVCNSSLTQKLKKIPQFTLNLGMSLTDGNNKVNPADRLISIHHMHHNQIIQKIGNLGKLPIYSHPSYDVDVISICCEDKKHDHSLSGGSIYNDLNVALDGMFRKLGMSQKAEEVTVKDQEPEKKQYIKPDKPLKDMTEAERLAFARSRN